MHYAEFLNIAFYSGVVLLALCVWLLVEWRSENRWLRVLTGCSCIGAMAVALLVLNNHWHTREVLHTIAIRKLGVALDRGELSTARRAIAEYEAADDRAVGALRLTRMLLDESGTE